MPTNMEVLISREQIAAGVARIGQEITRDFAGETVILLGVLKGACLFLSDLARQIELDATFDFIAVRSYGTKKESAGEVQLIKDVTTPLEDKNVILVEDILDTGLTFSFLKKLLHGAQAAHAEICRAAGQAFPPPDAGGGGLRRLQDSGQVCGRLRAGLRGALS